MFKIDRQKWLAAVAAAEGNPEALTRLYSIRAHARGRIHRRKARITWIHLPEVMRAQALAGCGSLVVELGMEDQVKLIGDAWKAFERSAVVPELLMQQAR